MLNSLSNERITADILIVDDTLVNLQLLSSMLLEAGYQVRQAASGEQALKAIEQALPDLVLLDIMMPEITGYELCKQLKTSTKTKNIPVIFISALGDVFDKVLAFDVGGADYITKPFRVQEVIARVQHQVTLRHQEKLAQAKQKQLQQEIGTLKVGEEDLYVYLNAVAKELQENASGMSMTLKQLVHQATPANTNSDPYGDGPQKTVVVASRPDIKIPANTMDQLIENCVQQLKSIAIVTKLVDPRKLY